MKLFMASIATETHTFAPLPTTTKSFEDAYLARGGDHPVEPSMFAMPVLIWRDHAKARGWEVIESLCTFATPSGVTLRKTFETFRDEILEDLHNALPVNAVMLSLHGAMVADGYDDCEGDLVHHIRQIVGPDIPIGAEYDLHCHISRQLIDDLTALVIFKEYPHTDFADRAEELWTIMEATLDSRIMPVMASFDCRMIGVYHTTREPMKSYVTKMKSLEGKDGVLSVSLGHGFPWADVKELSARVIVIIDNDTVKAARVAEDMGREFWTLRDEVTPRFLDIDYAIDRGLEIEGGPVVLADMADNPGGGAVGDSTFITERLMQRGIYDFAVGSIWDPIATEIAISHGVGSTINLRIGGKISAESGNPLDIKAMVKHIERDCVVKALGGSTRKLGDAVCLDVNGAEIIIHTLRCQNMDPNVFEKLDINYTTKKFLVVKSMQHFHAAYAPHSAECLYVAAPGTLAWDFTQMPYTKVARPVWPIDENPWAHNEDRDW